MSQGRSCPVTGTVVPSEPPARLPDRGVGLREQFVQGGRQGLLVAQLQLVRALLELGPFVGVGAGVLGCPDLVELGLELGRPFGKARAEARRLSLELVVAERPEQLFLGMNGVENRLDPAPLAVEPRSEDRGHQILDHSGSKYKRCRTIYSATASGTQYRIGSPARARRRISVAEMSTAGTFTEPAIRGEDGIGRTGAGEHDDPGQPRQLVRAVPGIELGGRVGTEQQREGRLGLASAKGLQGVHRVRGTLTLELRALDREAGAPRDGQLEHDGAMRGGRGVAPLLERLLPGREEAQLVQAERLRRDAGDDQVAVVNGIERAAEEADGGHAPEHDRRHPERRRDAAHPSGTMPSVQDARPGSRTSLGMAGTRPAGVHELSAPFGHAFPTPGAVGWNRRMYPQVSCTSSLYPSVR